MRRETALLIVTVGAAAADLVCAALGWEGVRAVTKPLPAVLLAVAALTAPRVPRVFGVGLLLAAAGDELLLRGGDLAFMAGMGAFAAMHVCYITTFARIGAGPGLVRRVPWLVLPFAAAVVGTNVLLGPQAGSFALPVALYSTLLGAMALCAVNAAGRVNERAARLIAGGALVFMVSDTTLAFAKFWTGFPLSGTAAELAIVGSYFAAQILIAGGVIDSARPIDATAS